MAKKEKKTPVFENDSSDSELIRRFKANPALFIGTFVVLVLVIVSFVLVPAIVPESSRGSKDFTFGHYDKAPISWVPGNVFAQYQENVQRYYQRTVGSDNLRYFNSQIWQQAFEAAAVHVAILQEMKRSKYVVPVKTVDRQVAQLPHFQENGYFSAALYRQMPESSRLTLWRQVQDDIIKETYINDLNDLLISKEEANFIGRMTSLMRKFEVASFNISDYPNSEYLLFANEHPELFNTIHLSRISVPSEKEAKVILASIKDGISTFEDAARSQSKDSYAEKGGDMGIRNNYEIEREIIEPELREKITGLNKGELSDIIRIGDLWVFFRVEDSLKTANFEEDSVMERVRSYVGIFEKGRMEDWSIARAKDFITDANNTNFDAALEKLQKTKNSFGPLPINYGDTDLFTTLRSFSIPELSNSSSNEKFWKTIFSTPVNTISEPLVQGSNVLVFLPTEEINAEESSIEGIESIYSSYWVTDRTQQSLSAYFLNSPKMVNRFEETYSSIFSSSDY